MARSQEEMMTAKLPRGGRKIEAGDDEDTIEESIEVSGVPLVVWAARLTLILLIQGLIVLGSYAYYGFATDPGQFGPGFRLDPIHAAVNFVWGLAGSVIGFFTPRLSISYMLAFAIFFTMFAGFVTFTPDRFGMTLDGTDKAIAWALAATGWAIAVYAIWQACLRAEGDG
jgi:hypothetical protein